MAKHDTKIKMEIPKLTKFPRWIRKLSKRQRKFINNFMMAKQNNDFIDNMNWEKDINLYKFQNLRGKFRNVKTHYERIGSMPEV